METWLKGSILDNEILPDDFTIFCKDIVTRLGSGILIAKQS